MGGRGAEPVSRPVGGAGWWGRAASDRELVVVRRPPHGDWWWCLLAVRQRLRRRSARSATPPAAGHHSRGCALDQVRLRVSPPRFSWGSQFELVFISLILPALFIFLRFCLVCLAGRVKGGIFSRRTCGFLHIDAHSSISSSFQNDGFLCYAAYCAKLSALKRW